MNPWGQPGGQPYWGGPGGQYPYGGPPQGGAYPYGQAPQPQFQPQPRGGGTAITAAVLAFLACPFHLLVVVKGISHLGMPHDMKGLALFVLPVLISVAAVIALIVGGILLLRRKSAGQILLVLACAGTLVLGTLLTGYQVVVLPRTWLRSSYFWLRNWHLAGPAYAAITSALILPFVLVPSTRRWCQARRPTTPPPPGPMGWPPAH